MAKRGVQLDGDRIMSLYKSKGWSQQDLARRAGLDARTVNKVCTGGTCDSSTHTFLAQALGVEPEELLATDEFAPVSVDAQAGDSGPTEEALEQRSLDLVVEQVWKIIDLRTELSDKTSDGETTHSAWVWDHYRIRKLTETSDPIVFPYLTWGDRIECELQPDGATWSKVKVRPGDLVHSEKQWELSYPVPEGLAGSVFEVSPIKMRFVGAFEEPDQQWWQVRVPFAIESVIIQVLFSPDSPCQRVHGSYATLATRQFVDAEDNAPHLQADGTLASWHIPRPELGAFYRIGWEF